MGQKIGLWQLHREELSGRNEIIATFGWLHPSRPQNKRLYTPWTKDDRHTRQDRWIQTDPAFTLAKNATKPDPVETVSLQTTRKENNWKTEETLARTVVTLETERIKLVQSLMYMMTMMNIAACSYNHLCHEITTFPLYCCPRTCNCLLQKTAEFSHWNAKMGFFFFFFLFLSSYKAFLAVVNNIKVPSFLSKAPDFSPILTKFLTSVRTSPRYKISRVFVRFEP